MITGGQSVVVMLLLPCDDGDEQGCESGVQKFRVKMLAESGGQSTVDVLCQIGLDGIRMLDPNTSRTLRIYPIENITRCDKFDSSTFAFWSKSSVDVVEPRRIRLQSNSYTTNTLLDTVTAHHTGALLSPDEASDDTAASLRTKRLRRRAITSITPHREIQKWVEQLFNFLAFTK
ncbi:Protein FREE1 [Glycine soja]